MRSDPAKGNVLRAVGECYGRGLDLLLNTYNFLDLTPYGRGEGWGGMPDVGGTGKEWLRHHDRY